jgi:transcriptional regulator with XRE-family HTH domain
MPHQSWIGPARRAAEFTQSHLAARVSRDDSYISMLEAGQRGVRPELEQQLLAALAPVRLRVPPRLERPQQRAANRGGPGSTSGLAPTWWQRETTAASLCRLECLATRSFRPHRDGSEPRWFRKSLRQSDRHPAGLASQIPRFLLRDAAANPD